MAQDKLTIIAELKDRLTGPAKKAAKALDELGGAAEKGARRTERAQGRADRAVEGSARRQGRAAREGRRAHEVTAAAAEKAAATVSGAAGRAASAQAQANRRMTSGAEGLASGTERAGRRVQRALERGLDPSRAVARWRRGLDQAVHYAMSAASRVNRAMATTGKVGAAGAAGVAAMSLKGGMGRLSGLQNTDVVLDVMDYSESDRKQLMDQFQRTALGTRYSTPDVAGLGASLLSSGLDREKLDTALSGAVDAASVYSLDLNDIAIPLQQIQTKGRLYAEEMMQLQEKRMDISGWLAEYKGVDRSKISDMVTKGQITPDDVFAAIAEATAGGAEKAGGTISGAWANFKNAFSMGGASFLKPMLDPFTRGMNQLRELIGGEEAGAWFESLGNRVAPGIDRMFERVPALLHVLAPLRPVVENLFSAVGSALPGLVDGFTNWLGIIVPIVQPLAEMVSLLVRGLAPTLPVLVPAVLAVTTALTGLRVAGAVAGGVSKLAAGGSLLTKVLGALPRVLLGKQGAEWATQLFGDRVVRVEDRVQSLAGQGRGGLGRFNDRLDSTTKKMGKAQTAARGLAGRLNGLHGAAMAGAKGLGVLGGLAMAAPLASAVQGGSLATGDESMANAAAGGSGAVDQRFRDAKWANGNAGWFQSLWSGSMKGVDNAGDVAAGLANMDVAGRFFQGINDWVGFENAGASAKKDLASLDSALASMVQSGDLAAAGQQFNTLISQAEAKGASQEKVMGLFPAYKGAVYDAFRQRGQQVDDNQVLQAMRSDRGFRGGGYTGDGPVDRPAGTVHGREYVFDAQATARIGVANLRRMHRGETTGGFTFAPTVHVSGGTASDRAQIRSTVQAVLREEARRLGRTHGTRSLKGAK